MTTAVFLIPNISCMHCVHTIQTELSGLEGIQSVRANVDTKQVEVVFSAPATEQQIKTLLAEINYPVAG